MTFRGWSLLILLPMLGIYFSGQAQAIQKGDGMVSFGASFGSLTQNFSQGLPGVNVTAEYGLKDNFGPGALGIGLFLGFKNELYNRVDGPFTYRGTLKKSNVGSAFSMVSLHPCF